MANEQQLPQVRYVPNMQPAETFADSITEMVWDGSTLRVEFCVTRYTAPGSGEEKPSERHPACRLVLTASAAANLFNRLQQTMSALTKAGVITARTPAQGGEA